MVSRVSAVLIAGLAIVLLMTASSSSGAERRRLAVALVRSRDLPPYQQAADGFREALEAGGYQPFIASYDLNGDAAAADGIANALRRTPPDLVLTQGSLATRAMAQRLADIPLVFCMVLEPEAGGQGTDASSRRNLTGVTMEIDPGLQLDAVREVLPDVKRVGILYHPRESGRIVAKAEKAAAARGLTPVLEPVGSERDVSRALRALSARVDVLMAVPDATVYTESSTRYILLHTLRQAQPFVGLLESFVEGGALMGIGLDYRDIGRQAGEAALRVAAGEPPSRVPIVDPRRTRLLLNLRTARRIGVAIPAVARARAEVVVP